jgi:hypothetical protein
MRREKARGGANDCGGNEIERERERGRAVKLLDRADRTFSSIPPLSLSLAAHKKNRF